MEKSLISFHKTATNLLYFVMVLLGISLGTFSLFSLAPGDPAEIILRDRHEAPSRQQIEILRQELGLDSPWAVRYLHWLRKVVTGDWGVSWRSGRPVWNEISARLPATFELALGSFFLVVTISVLCGVWAAFWKNRLPDYLVQMATIVFSSIPSYWLGLLLIYFLSVKMNLFPVTGRESLMHLVLPSFTLALSVSVMQGRVLRATLIRIMSMDYIRFAFAKGLSSREIFMRHIVPGAMPTMATMWGVSLGQLLGGAIIVENIFAWPGLGRLTVEAVMARDIPLVQAIVLLLAIIFVTVNQLVEKLHHRLDPKLGYAR